MGTLGSANGQFIYPFGIVVAANGNVFVADGYNHRVQYFTGAGRFVGKFGAFGRGAGEFNCAYGVAVSPTVRRVYVTDAKNNRIQYFRRSDPAVSPTSLGRVKALFR